ncbi:hypothetical protein DL765_003846 [Monosporascus sp. GIB2]|nr:hypothetical protein DL765_003846 [Monosporascus sp. GIB2]
MTRSTTLQDNILETKYTWLNPDVPLVIHVIRPDLTLHLNKAHNSHSLFLEVSLGTDLCRRPEFLHASIDSTEHLFRAAGALKTWPRLLRPVGKYFVPEAQTLRDHYRSMYEFLVLVARERRGCFYRGRQGGRPGRHAAVNGAQGPRVFGVRADEELAENQLVLSLATIHLTSRRFNPAAIVRFGRKVMKPLRFSDGTKIPAGSRIALFLWYVRVIPADSHVRDPEHYPEPTIFNPHRFADIRNGVKEDPLNLVNKEQYQFISPTKENTSFSIGRHACLGRFLAAHEIKMMAARVLDPAP